MNIDETLAKLEAGLAATGERLARLEEEMDEAREVFARYEARLALEREAAQMGAEVLAEVNAPRCTLNYEQTRGILVRLAGALEAGYPAQAAVCCPVCGAVGFPCDLPCAFCADAEAPDQAA